MKFEYHTFEVEPYLAAGNQPSFTMKGVSAASKYYTLIDPGSMKYSLTASQSEGVRIPVFAVATSPEVEQPEDVRDLTVGSMLFAMGLENAMRFIENLNLTLPIGRVVVVLATNCHELSGGRYRAYFGITVEVPN
jgi:hypothetical protein